MTTSRLRRLRDRLRHESEIENEQSSQLSSSPQDAKYSGDNPQWSIRNKWVRAWLAEKLHLKQLSWWERLWTDKPHGWEIEGADRNVRDVLTPIMIPAVVGFLLWSIGLANYPQVARPSDYRHGTYIVWSVGLILHILFMWLKWRDIRERNILLSRWHDTLTYIGVSIGFFLIAGAQGYVTFLNGFLDTSQSAPHRVTLVHKYASSARKPSLFLSVVDWHDPKQAIQVQVSKLTYESHHVGSTVEVTTKKGFFGYEWVVAVR